MTRGDLINEILSKGPISQDDLVAQMEAKGVVEVFTISVITGMRVRGEVEFRDGLIYKVSR